MGRIELEYPKDATNTVKRHSERGEPSSHHVVTTHTHTVSL